MLMPNYTCRLGKQRERYSLGGELFGNIMKTNNDATINGWIG